MAYEYTNSKGIRYYLNSKKVTLRGGNRLQVIYYFSKKPTNAAIDDLPGGFEVKESQRTGLPVLKRK
ncbi:MAG: hypothetical protein Q8Q24_00660 [bacterium]|nr:hypothetical protein [bacterium]